MEGRFFDAQLQPDGSYDREYYQADHAAYYERLFTTGLILRDLSDCEVKASGGAGGEPWKLTVAPGTLAMKGYQGDTLGDDVFVTQNLVNGLYRVIIRLDNSEAVRAFDCRLVYGSEAEYPALIREGNIYELCLANVTVTDGKPTVTDTRLDNELCGQMAMHAYPKQPPYYPPSDLPQELWTYSVFPETMTPEQIAQVESNPSLMEMFEGSITGRSQSKYLNHDTAVALGLPENSTVDKALSILALSQGWKLIQAYTSAGTFTWTAPDLFDGEPYQIGYFVIGGGGSGAAGSATAWANWDYQAQLSGGGSGYTKAGIITVTPGQEYAIVIGAGGASAVATQYSYGSYYNHAATQGQSGSTSSAFGATADGGGGGFYSIFYYSSGSGTHVVKGADGGQGSDAINGNNQQVQFLPAFGRTTRAADYANDIEFGGTSTPIMALNPFTMERCLVAGGGVGCRVAANSGAISGSAQNISPVSGGGLGVVGASASAPSATNPGAGGGACATGGGSGSSTAVSGRGAPGACYIYVRRNA